MITHNQGVPKLVSGIELENLVFGQQHPGTKNFFAQKCENYHTVPLSQMPHYLFLVNHLHKNPLDSHIYYDYLCCSWDFLLGSALNCHQRRIKQIKKFINLYEEIKQKRKILKPVITCTRSDGRQIIVDGNHRASTALALKMPLPAVEISPQEYLGRTSLVQHEFYGSGNNHIPYQSILDGKKVMVPGRRPDLLERMNLIETEDLKNRSVLDLGCNLGMNCFLAAQFQAREAVGIDVSPRLIMAALRLNAYYALPCDFLVHDLNTPFKTVKKYHTVFCFSLTSHVSNTRALVETILENTGKVLYLEGHSGTGLKDYSFLLKDDYFSSIQLKGYTRDSYRLKKYTRPFYRCIR
ncbi:MAG: methyltransferase domain-containing protein [Candidatus Contubernalis sp.]|nr:methyltransferase domain-containing protein [Candidatus Contubernalis sp.]